jgi:hypothetical protein
MQVLHAFPDAATRALIEKLQISNRLLMEYFVVNEKLENDPAEECFPEDLQKLLSVRDAIYRLHN